MTTPGFLFQSEALLLATPTDQLVDTNAALLDKALAFVDDGDSNIRYVYRRAATTGGLVPTGSPADGRWFSTSGGVGETFSTFKLVQEITIGTATNSITLDPGFLSIDSDYVLLLNGSLSSAPVAIYGIVNNDAVLTNYNSQYFYGDGTSSTAGRDNNPGIASNGLGSVGEPLDATVSISTRNSRYRFKSQVSRFKTGPLAESVFSTGHKVASIAGFTSYELKTSAGNFEPGFTVQVLKLSEVSAGSSSSGPALLLDVALSANVTPADQAPIPFDAGGSLIPSEWNGTAWTASQDYGLCDVTLNLRAAGSNRVVADTRLNGESINTIDIGATGGSAPSAAISKKVQISSGDVVSTRTFGFALRGDAGLSMSFMQVTRL
jgi:hypothetical protein